MSAARPTTRQAIAAAAALLFAQRGYAQTSVRTIAAEAGVDAALVIRHFGSKEGLFLESVTVDFAHQPLREWPLDSLGERFVEHLLEAGDTVRGIYLALVRASDAGEIGSRLRTVHEAQFVEPLLDRLEGPEAELRARLAAALVGGLLYSRWIVADDALVDADRAAIVRRYGALLQELLTPPE